MLVNKPKINKLKALILSRKNSDEFPICVYGDDELTLRSLIIQYEHVSVSKKEYQSKKDKKFCSLFLKYIELIELSKSAVDSLIEKNATGLFYDRYNELPKEYLVAFKNHALIMHKIIDEQYQQLLKKYEYFDLNGMPIELEKTYSEIAEYYSTVLDKRNINLG